jgi:hypothetical protein
MLCRWIWLKFSDNYFIDRLIIRFDILINYHLNSNHQICKSNISQYWDILEFGFSCFEITISLLAKWFIVCVYPKRKLLVYYNVVISTWLFYKALIIASDRYNTAHSTKIKYKNHTIVISPRKCLPTAFPFCHFVYGWPYI